MATRKTLILGIDATGASKGAATVALAGKTVTRSTVKMVSSVNAASGAMAKTGPAAVAAAKGTDTLAASMTRAGGAAVNAGGMLQKFLLPLAGFALFTKTAATVASFEEAMATVGAVSGKTSEELAGAIELAREMGATTRFSATSAAEGLVALSRAGFELNEAMAALEPSLDMATGGGLELGEAAGFVSNTIRQFSMDAEEAVRVANTFTTASNRSNTDMQQLAEAMKYAGTVAGSFNYSVEETAAALGVLADRGVKGSMAGTSLRGVLLALASPTDAAAAALDKLNIRAEELSPATHDLQEIAERLAEGIASLENPLEAAGLAADIFGNRNAAAAIAMADSAEKMSDVTREAQLNTTAAQDQADAIDNTLIGAWHNLKSAVEEAMHVLGESGVAAALRATVDTLAEMVRILAGVGGSWGKAGAAAKILATAVTFLTVAWTAEKAATLLTAAAKGIYAAACWTATTATGGLTAALKAVKLALAQTGFGLIAIAIGMAAAAFIAFRDGSDEATASAEEAAAAAKELEAAQRRLASQARETAESLTSIDEARRQGDIAKEIAAIRSRIRALKDLRAEIETAPVEPGRLKAASVTPGEPTEDSREELWRRAAYFQREPSEALRAQWDKEDEAEEMALQVTAVDKAIEALNGRVLELSPGLALLAAGETKLTAGLKLWHAENEQVIADLGRLGETAKETAVQQEAIAQARQLAAGSGEEATEAQIQSLADEIRKRKEAEAVLANYLKALRDAAKATRDQVAGDKAANASVDGTIAKMRDRIALLKVEASEGKEAATLAAFIAKEEEKLTGRKLTLDEKRRQSLKDVWKEYNNLAAAIERVASQEAARKSKDDSIAALEEELRIMGVLRREGALAAAEEEAVSTQRAALAATGLELSAAEAERIAELVRQRHELAAAIAEESAAREDNRQKIDQEDLAAQNARTTIRETVETLEAEIAALGKSSDERQIASEALAMEQLIRQALHGATEEQAVALELLRGGYEGLLERRQEAEQLQTSADAIAEKFGSAFQSVITGTASAKDALKSFMQAVINELLQVLVIKKMVASISAGIASAKGNVFQGGEKVEGYAAGGVFQGGRDMDYPTGGKANGAAYGGVQRYAHGGVVNNSTTYGEIQRYAHGGVVNNSTTYGEIQRYAAGGVVDRATFFPMKGGKMGLMGEAGPEAIMPLERGRDGKLGVKAQGDGGARNVTVNMRIVTPDADSFRKSKRQLSEDMRRAATSFK